MKARIASLVLLPLLAGCATIPVQSDLTRISTVDIINNVRCEAQEAFSHWVNDKGIAESTISYGFEFAALETNGLSGAAAFFIPVHAAGSLVLGVDAGETKARRGYTKIDVVDVVKQIECIPGNRRESFRLPITGTVGLAEEIDTYARLRRQGPMTVGDYTRELKFTYTISGGVNPVLTLLPVHHLQRASLNLSGERSDEHKLTIIIAAASGPKKPTEIKLVSDVVIVPKGGGSTLSDRRSGSGDFVVQGSRARGTSSEDAKQDALRRLEIERARSYDREIVDRIGPIP